MSEHDQHEVQDFIQHSGSGAVALAGDWTTLNVGAIRKALKNSKLEKQHDAAPDLEKIKALDTTGVWLIRKTFGSENDSWKMTDAQKKLFDFLPDGTEKPPKRGRVSIHDAISSVGERTIGGLDFVYSILCFTGAVFICLTKNIFRPGHFRIASITRHVQETGLMALPIIGLLGFLMSMVVSYQGAIQLQKFGADIFTIDLTVISMLREMAVLVTAIMVGGRSGSAFAAEIGVMKLRRETDALQSMGLDPIELLVVPRVLALMITLPLLTFFADIVGLTGGAVMAKLLLNIDFAQYIQRTGEVATPEMFFVGMIKAPFFAFLISVICTFQGMSASGSAESVGKLTTLAVVQSIFLVIMADALFSIVFSKMGI